MECRVDGVIVGLDGFLSTWCNRREARSRSAGSITSPAHHTAFDGVPTRRSQSSATSYAFQRHSGWHDSTALLGWLAVASAMANSSSRNFVASFTSASSAAVFNPQ